MSYQRSIAVFCLALCLSALPAFAGTGDAPQNLQVQWATDFNVELVWDPPTATAGALYEVYRNGQKITPGPLTGPTYFDYGLAPATPVTYTVEAIDPFNLQPVGMSDRVSAATLESPYMLRVPEDVPTISQALLAAPPGTIIQVTPGIYTPTEDLFFPVEGVTLRCRDANGCVLDFGGTAAGYVDLWMGYGANTISGFTILGATVFTDSSDTVANCIFRQSPYEAIYGAGFVTNCVFDEPRSGPAIYAPYAEDALMVANSILMGPAPLARDPYMGTTILVTNNFVHDPQWTMFAGEEGNYSEWPDFLPPGPPTTYFFDDWNWSSMDRGTDVGLPFTGPAPDVGAFETMLPYTPLPPTSLGATYNNETGATHLTWQPSANDGLYGPAEVFAYDIFRSPDPTYVPQEWDPPYASVPNGVTSFEDAAVIFDTEYTYHVVAAGMLFSGPSNAAAVTPRNLLPVAQDDTAVGDANATIDIPVLANDTDGDNHTLSIVATTAASYGTVEVSGDSITYTPPTSWFGEDTFTYTISDGFGGTSAASVAVTIVPVGPVMRVTKLRLDWKKTYMQAAGTIKDGFAQPVMGALVTGEWSGPITGPATGTTDSKGNFLILTPPISNVRGETFTFTITGVELNTAVYDASLNVATSASKTAR